MLEISKLETQEEVQKQQNLLKKYSEYIKPTKKQSIYKKKLSQEKMDKGWNPLIILYRNFTFLGLSLK